MTAERRLLSISEACQETGVTRRTIYNWIFTQRLEYIRTAGGAIRIYADSLWRDAEKRPLPKRP